MHWTNANQSTCLILIELNEPRAGSKSPSQTATPDETTESLDKERNKRLLALFEEVIARLKEDKLTFIDWLLFIFDHECRSATKTLRRIHFWQYKDKVIKLLNSFIHSQQTDSGRELVWGWLIDMVISMMKDEVAKITKDGALRSWNKLMGPSFLKEFRIRSIKETLQEYCPTSVKVLMSVAGVDQSQATFKEAPPSAQNLSTCP